MRVKYFFSFSSWRHLSVTQDFSGVQSFFEIANSVVQNVRFSHCVTKRKKVLQKLKSGMKLVLIPSILLKSHQ